jgi:outer membrane protein OmpA-like peptidoglycan-associated protein
MKLFKPTPWLPRLLALSLCATLVACAYNPPRNAELEQARSRLNLANQDGPTRQVAGDALRQANDAVMAAEKANTEGDSPARVAHLSYMANQYLTLTESTAEARTQQQVTARAGAERERMRLTQRTQEADAAQSALVQAKAQGQQQQVALAQAQQQGDQQQAALALSDAKLRSVREELKALNAKPTERGQVVTLGDVLFATGASSLQEQGMRHLMGLADFLKRHPEQQAAIDGYTDNVGSAASNQLLSERRASSVREGLIRLGVNARQLSSQGHGEMEPQASNESAEGRQINRRVEVLVTALAQAPR